jgi:8-oxo-dGTP diphosphatase
MQKIEVVGAAIIENRRVLVAQRSPQMITPRKWEFVGGKVEQNETHQQALTREVFEELNIKIEVHEHIATGFSTFDEKEIVLHIYKTKIIEGRPTAKEHSQLRWVYIKDLFDLDWAEADIPAVKELVLFNNTNF